MKLKKTAKKLTAEILILSIMVCMFSLLSCLPISALNNSYNFENYGFQNNANGFKRILANANLSDEQKCSGNFSVKVLKTTSTAKAYFPIGDGSTLDEICKLEKGKRYVISFKFMLTAISNTFPEFTAVCSTSSSYLSAYANSDTSTAKSFVTDADMQTNVWLGGAFLLDTSDVTDDASCYLYMLVNSINNSPVYIDDVTVLKIGDMQTVYTVNNPYGTDIPSYVFGDDGTDFTFSVFSSDEIFFNGLFYDKEATKEAGEFAGEGYLGEFSDTSCVLFSAYSFLKPYGFETYLSDFEADLYPDYFGMDEDYEIEVSDLKSDTNASNIHSGEASLHRLGTDGLLRNAMLLGKNYALQVGSYYTVSMFVKMDKYAQTDGAVSILENASPSYPWNPASCGDGDWTGDYENDYHAVIPITSLTDGVWHKASVTFCADAPYVAVQTPGYCSIYIDDISVKNLGQTASETDPPSYTPYTQKKIEDPDYAVSGEKDNILSFEHYPYSLGENEILKNTSSAGKKSLLLKSTDAVQIFNTEKGKTYKISFDYKATDSTTVFFSSDGYKYSEDGEFLTLLPSSYFKSVTTYLTVISDGALYISKDGGDVILDNFSFTEITSAVKYAGASVLTDNAYQSTGNQAVRFFFNYSSDDALSVNFDNTNYTLIKRSIRVFANNGTKVVTEIKTDNLNDVWSKENDSVTFSYYIYGLKTNDKRVADAIGYLTLADQNGNVINIGSPLQSESVKTINEKLGIDLSDATSFKIGSSSLSSYKIVLPYEHSYILTEAAYRLQNSFKNAGVNVGISLMEPSYGFYEIRIGKTSRTKTPTPENEDYIITGVNSGFFPSLEIIGGDDLATYKAVNILADKIDAYAKRGKCIAFPSNSTYLSGTLKDGDTDYTLVFDDEFEGSTLNRKIWSNYASHTLSWGKKGNAFGGTDYTCTGVDIDPYVKLYGTGETVTPLEQKDGVLHMRAARITERGREGGLLSGTTENDTVSTQISTIKTMLFKYGCIEIRGQLGGGKNYTTFWINGDTSGAKSVFPQSQRKCFAEFDINETFGYGEYIAPNVHKWWTDDYNGYNHNSADYVSSDGYGNYNQKNVSGSRVKTLLGSSKNFSNSMHIYTMEWDNEKIVFAIDGREYYTYNYCDFTSVSICNLQNFFILSSGLSKSTTSSDPVMFDTQVDYVRIYQKSDRGDSITFAEQ